jgi:hypothetical protein
MKWRAASAAALLAVLWYFTPPSEPGFRLCGFHWLTALPCPLCGLTRGLFAFAKGHWYDALHWNALTPLGFAMLSSLFWNHPLRGHLWTVGVAAFAGYGVVRLMVLL